MRLIDADNVNFYCNYKGDCTGKYIDTISAEMTHEDIRKVLRKLAEYEDLEDRLNGISIQQVVDGFVKAIENQACEGYEHGRILTNEEANQWNEYRQLDEQGLLLRLPCKIGDTVWDNDSGRTVGFEVTGFSFGDMNEGYCDGEIKVFNQIIVYYKNSRGSITGSFAVSEIGKTVFLTKAEAEQKLKEMESD